MISKKNTVRFALFLQMETFLFSLSLFYVIKLIFYVCSTYRKEKTHNLLQLHESPITQAITTSRRNLSENFSKKSRKNPADEPSYSTLTDLYRSRGERALLLWMAFSMHHCPSFLTSFGSSTDWIHLVFEAKYASEITVPQERW